MRDDEGNVVPLIEEGQRHQALKFFFTPVDAPRPAERNPHARASTHVPEVIESLRAKFGDAMGDVEEYAGEHTIFFGKDRIVEVCRFLREQGFTYLADLGGIDRFTEKDRYEVFYNIVSFEKRKRLRLKVRIDESDLTAPTMTQVYRSANWNERETYDMFGIVFDNHPDMRRMFMPEDFEYHPLRKEFPQLGIPGSLPLPPQSPEGSLTMDPFAAAHGSKPVSSFAEPRSGHDKEEEDR